MNHIPSRIQTVNWTMQHDSLTDEHFFRIAEIVGKQVGIKLPLTKKLMVESRLRRRIKVLGLPSVNDYCHFLFEHDGLGSEQVFLIDAVTTNKTDFFREIEHFHFLEGHVVPELLKRRAHGSGQPIKLWSAASSNGAEAYTMAMVMAEISARIGSLPFSILGTDISTEMLDAAQCAIYSVEAISPVPAMLRQRYFLHGAGPLHQGKVRVAPELRRFVQFRRMNLMDVHYPMDRDVDVIFLRNVLIYFEKETQEAVVRRLVGHLRPGGFLFLGHSESMIGSNMGLRQWSPGVFGRAD